MASAERLDQPAEVASKVLRRAQVSKMTRALQNRLALANVKIKHGWENMSLDTIEPKVEMELKRKWPGSSVGAMSDTSSSKSDRFHRAGVFDSSPLAPPMFSDDIGQSGSSHGYRKRARYQQPPRQPASSSHARTKVRTASSRVSSWKSTYKLPASSPVYRGRHVNFSVSHAPSLSFVSETSTIPDEPVSPLLSEDDDTDLPLHSFQIDTANICSSPPRSPCTPPPELARSARIRNKAFNPSSCNPQAGEEGADLLLFLAASPSPANPGSQTRIVAPSTPPPRATPLPSSMMFTPEGGATGPLGFGSMTPGMGFNFADYLNVTPSPGQAGWARTPATAKTPLAAREARRRLNFDSLLPPTSSGSPGPGSLDRSTDSRISGLGMELGGELVSSQ